MAELLGWRGTTVSTTTYLLEIDDLRCHLFGGLSQRIESNDKLS